MRFSPIQILFFDANHAQCHLSLVKGRVDPQFAFKLGARFLESLFVEEDQAQMVVRLGLIGIEVQGGPKMSRRGVRLAQRAQHFPQPHVRGGVVRVRPEKILVERGGFA